MKTKKKAILDEKYLDRRIGLLENAFLEKFNECIMYLNRFPENPKLAIDCIHLRDALTDTVYYLDMVKTARAAKRWAKGEF